MVTSIQKKNKRELDFELNLIPAIDVLSTCICFLLLTAVWIHMGVLKLDQGVGETNATNGVNPPSLWVQVERSGKLQLSTRDLPSGTKGIEGVAVAAIVAADGTGTVDRVRLSQVLQTMQKRVPTLSTVIVKPQTKVSYGHVIAVIDQLKAAKVKDVGIVPES